MTTTNSYESLIEKVGGIEKAKAIVEGAPEWASIYDPDVSDYFKGDLKGDRDYWLDDLRDAIEYHYYGRSEAEELAVYAELSQEKIEGVTTFDEWWKVNELKYDYVFPASRDAFKAGQQSRQAEVDLLQQYNDDLAGGQCCLYRELKEKDKRIEAAMSLIQAWNDQGYRDDAEQLINVDLVEALRGERE